MRCRAKRRLPAEHLHNSKHTADAAVDYYSQCLTRFLVASDLQLDGLIYSTVMPAPSLQLTALVILGKAAVHLPATTGQMCWLQPVRKLYY